MSQSPRINCGLPQTRNQHPDAGSMSHLTTVGAVWGCLPCANKRAAGRRLLVVDFADWLDPQLAVAEVLGELGKALAYQDAIRKLREMNEDRKRYFHAAVETQTDDI